MSDANESCSESSLHTIVADSSIVQLPHSAVVATLVPTLKLTSLFCLAEAISMSLLYMGVVLPYFFAKLEDRKLRIWITNASSLPQIIPSGSRVATLQTTVDNNFAILHPATFCNISPSSFDFNKTTSGNNRP